ncbi:MAG: efflux RND transporter periplasmic adaptor subunit [Desulfuromonadaceae bacterium]|nr:efflux RND transporter periplasmic adaptor subunit [Desulfuromonadaceae bacterium]MDD2849913.1 efflux RND transporter periplasmic adaptor subunit [Desulfuromonadaceae bacterium]MDD4131728.1 efflux RND transporter periplasmic adaptor subunit [Desulfuromonadaceae bacterium]
MKKPGKTVAPALLILAIAALVFFAMRPKPVHIETGQAMSGPLQETVEAEGETRAHERYTVAAPVSGRLMRIELHDGDRVTANQAVAVMTPTPLDKRERDAAAARVSAAASQLRAAGEQAARDRADLEQARRELARTRQLARQGLSTTQALEQAVTTEQRAARTLAAAEYLTQTATAQLREARAALPDGRGNIRSITLRAPRSGPVLRVLEKSERIVTAGTPLLLIGDPQKLEVVADVLSSDAVKISAGAPVTLDEWGGPQPLRGVVRLVEPYAFTKISALGIEEQRVNIIIDFCDPPGTLGDGYRVMARIITWSGDTTVKIPINALFRQGENWCVFVVKNDRVARRTVTVGHRNQTEAEILNGLSQGETVVSHPSSQLDDGMRVRSG